jgi:hypothetical protein
MLRGIESNTIIVGGYTDRNGGICPMLAAHRNGGRTSFASFARAWDAFTGAGKRPRRASRRELRALRTYLEMSLLEDDTHSQGDSLTEIAKTIRTERREIAERTTGFDPAEIEDPFRVSDLRPRRSWLRATPRYDVYEATLAAAEEEMAGERVDEPVTESLPHRGE